MHAHKLVTVPHVGKYHEYSELVVCEIFLPHGEGSGAVMKVATATNAFK